MEGQLTIFDFPEYLPEGSTKEKCKMRAECEAYPIGCGGTIEPCRFGGPFKWSGYMNPPEG